MATVSEMKATARPQGGKGAARAVRREGRVPGVIYGDNKPPLAIAVDLIDLRTIGEPLLGQILKHGRQVRGEAVDLAPLMQRHVYAMEDFMPYVERMLEERKQAWIG